MANYDIRCPIDDKFGQLSAGVTSLDTTLTSPDFASLPSDLSVTKYVPMTIVDDSARLYETVWITGHAAGSSAVTVVRGREGTTARAWATASVWKCAPTVRDVISTWTRATLPGDAHLGMRAQLQDESGRIVEKTAAGWRTSEAPFAHAGITTGFVGVPANGLYCPLTLQDSAGGMTFNAGSSSLTVPIAGRYRLTCKAYATGSTVYQFFGDVTINDAAVPPATSGFGPNVSFWKQDSADYFAVGSCERRLNAGDVLRLYVRGGGGAASTYGSTGYNGSWLEALYVAA
ncbi:hypothetical protein [Pseudonocardia sp. D17]|uniref:hypothetical protein n=1 Tax=Pseudonocardia sp. D17 TaxID=882661 RepID=UPI002B3796E0|nr:hypothetical protein PSD17_39180 [Pseudonocardia sp. D17]